MATLLSPHQLQSNQLLYNAPAGIQINIAPSGHHQHQGHYCKDCGVMFESSTSLNVHLSYHKENLLSRWANQDALDKCSNSSSGSGSQYANPSSPSPVKREGNLSRSDNSSVESLSGHQYIQMEPHHYPVYNNNTGDQGMHSPSPTTPSFRPTFMISQAPVESPNGGPSIHPFHPDFHPNFPHHQFSPNHGGHNGSEPPSAPQPPQGAPRPQGSRESAEILDLDSHKVHVYQPPHQQGGLFHRPYLPHLLPPLHHQGPPPHPNGQWPNEFPNRFSPAGYQENGFYPPTTSAGGPLNGNGLAPQTFEILRIENPNYDPHPQGFPHQQQQLGSHGQSHPAEGPRHTAVTQFSQQSPYQQHQLHQNQNGPPKMESTVSPPGSRTVVPKGPNRSPVEATPGKNGSPGVKTKGWKGGECKRPKTYNCPACNKWFTSSGHLKRHYGTTLHKNSMKQLGDGAEELFKNQPKRKGAKGGQNGEKTPKQSKKIKLETVDDDKNDKDIGFRPLLQLQEEDDKGPHGENGDDMKPHPFLTNPPQPHQYPPTSSSPNPYTNYPQYAPPPGNNPLAHHHHHHHQLHSPHLPPYAAPSNGNGGIYPPEFRHQSPGGFIPSFPPVVVEEIRERQQSGPLPPFSSVGMSHYDAGLRTTPPYPQMSLPQINTSTPSPIGPGGPSNGIRSSPYDHQGMRGNNVRGGDGVSDLSGSGSDDGGGSSSSPSSGSEGTTTKEMKEVHNCPSCSKTFNRSCYLKQHFKQLHSNSPSGSLHKCHVCGKRFPEPEHLAEHLAKHGSDKPHKCELCPKTFNHKTDLNRHHLLHTGDRPFVCDFPGCRKGFIRKDHMTKHSETHRRKSHLNSISNVAPSSDNSN